MNISWKIVLTSQNLAARSYKNRPCLVCNDFQLVRLFLISTQTVISSVYCINTGQKSPRNTLQNMLRYVLVV